MYSISSLDRQHLAQLFWDSAHDCFPTLSHWWFSSKAELFFYYFVKADHVMILFNDLIKPFLLRLDARNLDADLLLLLPKHESTVLCDAAMLKTQENT